MKALAGRVLPAVLALLLPAAALAEGNWFYYERLGDERLSQERFEDAAAYFQRALREAGDQAPRTLWDKYNRCYMASLRAAAVARAQREAAAQASAPAAPPEAGAAAGLPTTSAPSAVVATDALTDLMAGAQGARMGAASQPAATPTTKPKPYYPGGWADPFADRTGGQTAFGVGQKVPLDNVVTTVDGSGVEPQGTTVETPEYVIENISVRFQAGNKVLVTGTITNRTTHTFNNPRVYVRLYNESGVFRGRNFGYVEPGRTVLGAGATKSFKVPFQGYNGTVGGYKVEVVTNLGR